MTSGFNWYEICEIWLFGPVTKLRIGRRCCRSCASQPVPWRLYANTEAAGLRKEREGDDLSNSRRGLKQTIKRRLQFRYAFNSRTIAPGNIVVEKSKRETFLQLYSARAYKMYRKYGTANSLLERCCPVCCQNKLLAQRGEIPSEASRRIVWDLRR